MKIEEDYIIIIVKNSNKKLININDMINNY